MTDIVELMLHWYAGRSRNEIAQSLGVDRKTIRKYLAPAEAEGLVPGGPPISEAEWAERVRGWFPELVDSRLRQVTWPEIAKHHDYLAAQLKAGVTMATIHQRLRDEHGLGASVASFRRYVAANVPEETRRGEVTVRALTPAVPGETAEIDYGRLGTWTDPASGRRRVVWAFVMALPCSRHLFVRPVLTMDQYTWTAAHVAAFGFFGGVPARLVPDNLKTGVDRPDLYDPKINRSYAELAAYYGVLVDPARAFRPRDKPHVERHMPYVRDSFWRGRQFASLDEMTDAAADWCLTVAGTRACRPLGGAAPLAVFEAVERPALRPLPASGPFSPARWSTAKVGPDLHAHVGGVLYSLPWRYIGQTVDARATATMVQFFAAGQLIKTHVRSTSRQTDLNDYPPEKIAFHMRTPTWCRTQAARIGPACVTVIAELLADGALYRLRAAQGVLGLADRHNPARLEAACARAIDAGDPSYRTVKGILATGADKTSPTPPPAGDSGAPAFLHGPDKLFADVIPLAVPPAPHTVDPATTTGPTGHGQAS